jgi:hypothetical protein
VDHFIRLGAVHGLHDHSNTVRHPPRRVRYLRYVAFVPPSTRFMRCDQVRNPHPGGMLPGCDIGQQALIFLTSTLTSARRSPVWTRGRTAFRHAHSPGVESGPGPPGAASLPYLGYLFP